MQDNDRTERLRNELNTHRKMMRGVVYNILQDSELAEDVTQDAVVMALEKLHKFDETRGKFSTWLCQVAINIALQQVKTRKRMPKVDLDDVHIANEEVVHKYSDDEAFTKEFHQRVIDIINRDVTLKKYDLTGLFIDYYSGDKGFARKKGKRTKQYMSSTKTMSLNDIAFLSDLPPATIRTMFARMLKKIAREMKSPEKEFENKGE